LFTNKLEYQLIPDTSITSSSADSDLRTNVDVIDKNINGFSFLSGTTGGILGLILLIILAVTVILIVAFRNKRSITPVISKQNEPEMIIGTFCPSCGARLENNSAFCVKCGYKIK
jgi:hypothetical protein